MSSNPSTLLGSICIIVFVATCCATSSSSSSLKALIREKRFGCIEKWKACRGVSRCCGKLQCYWDTGYSISKSGYCVKCVKEGQFCQRDSQCCDTQICQKAHGGRVDGTCQTAGGAGTTCWRDFDCLSNSCEKGDWHNYFGHCSEPKEENVESATVGDDILEQLEEIAQDVYDEATDDIKPER